MSSEAFTSSTPEDPVFSFGERMRVLRRLRELEFGMLDRGSTPEGAVLTVYKRALEFYDSQWPNDEGKFRNTLLGMQEKRMTRIMKEKRVTIETAANQGLFGQ
jgi:hypothetical protein